MSVDHDTRNSDGEYHPDRIDLADLYSACLKHSNPKLVINLRTKGSMLAQDTRYSQDDFVAALRPLEAQGFVRIQCGDIFGKGHDAQLAVRVKSPEADPTMWKYRKVDRPTAGGVAVMPSCSNCDAHVSDTYARVNRDRDGIVRDCPHCNSDRRDNSPVYGTLFTMRQTAR